MQVITVKSQAELDAVPVDFCGRIYIEFGTPYNRAVVNRLFQRASVVANGNSSVVAWGNSSVVASGNSQICDRTESHKLSTSGNARIVHDPKTIAEYLEHHQIENDGVKAKLFKAVHKVDWRCVSDKNNAFEYRIGETAIADKLDTDPDEECGHGIHMAHKAWCLNYGRAWQDLAILEVEVDIAGIVLPRNCAGKVRAASVKVLREVPLEECGLFGKMLAKKRKEE